MYNIAIFHTQIATLALCILAGCYSHAGDIIVAIGDQEVTVDMLTELDRLVQLLESPIFTFVRMEVSQEGFSHSLVPWLHLLFQLLDGDPELLSAMYGLLMLLPQSDAFHLVKGRLACVPQIHKQDKARQARRLKRKKYLDEIDFPSLLEHFQVLISALMSSGCFISSLTFPGGGAETSAGQEEGESQRHPVQGGQQLTAVRQSNIYNSVITITTPCFL